MAVIHLFDSRKRHKRMVKDTLEIMHKEGEYTATAQIGIGNAVEHGDCFGFRCVDGRFRLFLIHEVEKNEAGGYLALTGYDAALAELDRKIIPAVGEQEGPLRTVVGKLLEGTAWTVGQAANNDEISTLAVYFQTVWSALHDVGLLGKVRVVPYYEFREATGEISARKIDLQDKTPVFRGMMLTRRKGASNIHILREGTPYGRVYPVGKIVASGDPPEQVTIADAVWSTASGNPANKPKDQLWLELPGAVTDAEYKFEDKRETDAQKLLEKAWEDLQKKSRPTVSGTADVAELEHVPGYEHRQIRMWDLLPVRTEDGEVVEATVVNITRYYVHRELTKITIGNEDDETRDLESLLARMEQLLQQTAVSAGSAGAGAGKAEKMVLEATESITLLSERVDVVADEIELRATSAEVQKLRDGTDVTFQETVVAIAGSGLGITTLETTVNNITNEVNTVKTALDVQAGKINTLVTNGENMQTSITQTLKYIQTLVKSTSTEGEVLQSAINQTANSIALAVQKGKIIASINASPEVGVVIDAIKVDLGDYATVAELEAEIADLFKLYGEVVATTQLYASQAEISDDLVVENDMHYGGKLCSWDTATVQTSIPEFDEATIPLANGNKINVVIGWKTAPSVHRKTLKYMSYIET